MTQNSQVSITIPSTVINAVIADLKAATDALLPYLHPLTTDQRQQLPKMSNKTVSFVSKVIGYTDTNAEFSPAYLDVAELKTDYNAVAALKPALDMAEQLFMLIEDTAMLAGSEAYTASLLYYNSVRGAAKQGISTAGTVYNDLQERFPGAARKKAVASAGV